MWRSITNNGNYLPSLKEVNALTRLTYKRSLDHPIAGQLITHILEIWPLLLVELWEGLVRLESIRLLFFYSGIQKYIRRMELLKPIKEFISSIP